MRTMKILQQTITPKLQIVHTKRLKAVFWAVQSLLVGGKLSLTALGRSGAITSKPKHAIKRMDRLLKNPKLHDQIPLFYKAMNQMIVGRNSRPVILVDWTKIEPGHVAIAATAPMDGRSLPVYLEVHPAKLDNNPDVLKRFLHNLSDVLPSDCRPIIVSDAGFKNNWFTEVAKMGWDFVGRIRGKTYVKNIENNKWLPAKELFKNATTRPQNLGKCILTKSNSRSLKLVLVRKRKPKPTQKYRVAKRKKQAIKGALEPWLLATSLDNISAKRLVELYAKRMQIEETFRDAKNHRFGWSFKYARSNSSKRYEVLLLIAALGMLVVTIIGYVAEKRGIHRHYQANTVRKRRVLSLFYLGCMLAKLAKPISISLIDIRTSIRELREKQPVINSKVKSYFVGIP